MQVEMRKKKRQITDPAQIEAILKQEKVLRLAMSRDDQPYLVPLNYGYEPGHVYVHTGPAGLKLDILRQNPKVCFEVTTDLEIQRGEAPCKWTTRFQSVIGFGRAVLLDDPADKEAGLRVITAHHAGPGDYEFPEDIVARTTVIRVDIESLTGARHPVPDEG